jgi:hypothetical protein
MNSLEYIARSVSRLINEYNEMEIIKYYDLYKVVMTICQEEPPFKDFIGVGMDRRCPRRAARKAMLELYQPAYS